MKDLPTFIYNEVPICIKPKTNQLGIFIKP